MKRHPLIAFFVLMFAISWGIWLPLASAIRNSPTLATASHWPTWLHVIGAFGPCLAALLVTGIVDGAEGLRQLFRRLLVWRVHCGWFMVALLLPAGISLLITAIHMMFGGDAPNFGNPPIYSVALPAWLKPYNAWTLLIPVFLMQLVMGSSLGEELGWRGFALARLQQRFSALDASLIIAVVWAFWAQPLFHLQRVQAGEWLTVEDFKNLPDFVQKLQRGSDPVSHYLPSRFSAGLRAFVMSTDGSPEQLEMLQYPLLAEMNQLMQEPSLYEEARFQHVTLSPITRKLLARESPAGLQVRINRLLLQDAYPHELGKTFSVYLMPFILLLIGVIPAQILIAWIFNSTGGSLLLVVLYNNALKTTDLFLVAPNAGQLIPVAAYWVITLLIVSAVGTKRLTLHPPANHPPAPQEPSA